MNKNLLAIYRVPFLISLTLGIVLSAVDITREPVSIALTFAGTILGTFFMDLEYFLYAFFIEPKTDFSKTFTTFIRHKDFSSAAQFIQIHKSDIKDKTINSALFQVVFAIFTLYVVSSSRQFFIKGLVISVLANSIYRLIEAGYDNKLDDWFWALKDKPTQQTVSLYIIGLVGVLIYCVANF
jgi:hypothetical protein